MSERKYNSHVSAEYTEYEPLPPNMVSTSQSAEQYKENAKAWQWIYILLIATSVLFASLNLVQIALIFQFNHHWWTAVFPGCLFGVSFICLGIVIYPKWKSLSRSWRAADWQTRVVRAGVIVTMLLNILACEFGYLNFVAVNIAHEKRWVTSISMVTSFAPPAVALGQDSIFTDRAILASDTEQLHNFYLETLQATTKNQRAFDNFTSIQTPENIYCVSFDGSYPNLTIGGDLDLFYQYYQPSANPTSPLFYMLFDPKFLASQDLFQKASDCGLIGGTLFQVSGRSQIAIEQIIIDDNVNAIDYSYNPACDIPEFRKYITYRSTLTFYEPQNHSCLVDGNTAPAGPNLPQPCIGDLDIKFSTMLVTKQTSAYSKGFVDMITDEGGIIGGIMFLTWFMSILNQ